MLHACIVCTCTLAQLLKLVKHLPKAVMIRGDANGVVHIRMVRVIASFSHFIALGHEVRFFFKRGGRIDCKLACFAGLGSIKVVTALVAL